jgi:hypothetical protein
MKLTYPQQKAIAGLLLAIDLLVILNWMFSWGLAGKFAGQACAIVTILIFIAFNTVLTGPPETERDR